MILVLQEMGFLTKSLSLILAQRVGTISCYWITRDNLAMLYSYGCLLITGRSIHKVQYLSTGRCVSKHSWLMHLQVCEPCSGRGRETCEYFTEERECRWTIPDVRTNGNISTNYGKVTFYASHKHVPDLCDISVPANSRKSSTVCIQKLSISDRHYLSDPKWFHDKTGDIHNFFSF